MLLNLSKNNVRLNLCMLSGIRRGKKLYMKESVVARGLINNKKYLPLSIPGVTGQIMGQIRNGVIAVMPD